MNKNQDDTAYLTAKIVEDYMIHGYPAIVMPVGVVGEYFLVYNPNADTDPWMSGFYPAPAGEFDSQPEAAHVEHFPSLGDAHLQLETQLKIAISNKEAVDEYEKMINRVIAYPLKADFTVCDESMSGSPSLTLNDDRTQDDYFCFCIILETLQIELNWSIRVGSIGGNVDGEQFDSFEQAEQFLIEKHAVRLADDRQTKSELRNFLDMLKLLRHQKP